MLDKDTLSQVSYAISHELLRRMPANKGVEYIRGYSCGSRIAHEVVRKMIDTCGLMPMTYARDHTTPETDIVTPQSVTGTKKFDGTIRQDVGL
jgi:hypothetical protein